THIFFISIFFIPVFFLGVPARPIFSIMPRCFRRAFACVTTCLASGLSGCTSASSALTWSFSIERFLSIFSIIICIFDCIPRSSTACAFDEERPSHRGYASVQKQYRARTQRQATL